jgi:hypothetical protein
LIAAFKFAADYCLALGKVWRVEAERETEIIEIDGVVYAGDIVEMEVEDGVVKAYKIVVYDDVLVVHP